jgi:hypothetical protein
MTLAVSGLSAALYQDEPEEYVVTAALGSNRDICFVSKNGVTNSIEIVVGGSTAPLSVAVVGDTVTVTSANTDGSATSTPAQIVAAVNGSPTAFAKFLARLPPGQTGAGVTGAMSELHAANGTVFTTITLVDSGDHLTYQAAAASRYWDPALTLTIYDNAAPITTGIVNHIRGSVTFPSTMSGHTITATGTKRSILAMRRVLLVYDGKLKIDGKEIDTSNLDDSGWGSAVMGSKQWEISGGAYYYDGNLPITQIGSNLITKFYSIYASNKSFTGRGAIMNMENLVASASEAQKQTITIKGSGEIYPE